MIDPHVHLRDWSQKEKETLLHGMETGVRCGITRFFDMPNTLPALTDTHTIKSRLRDADAAAQEVAARTGVFPSYHVYAGITAQEQQIKEMVAVWKELFPRVIGFKLFAGHSTGNMGLVEEDKQREVYNILSQSGYTGVLAVHCEKESLLSPSLWRVGQDDTHSFARPPIAELASVIDQIQFSREADFPGTLHICHISTEGALEVVKEARQIGMNITCGATAHHALLTSQDAKDGARHAKMNPPLRTESDRAAIFHGLMDGSISWIESDHAPHTLRDKEEGASGIPGFAGTLYLISALRKAGCSEERLAVLLGGAVEETFRLPRNVVSIPSETELLTMLPQACAAYPWNPFYQ